MGPDEVLLVFILNINNYSFLKNMAEDNVRMRQREEVRTQTHTAPANATATSSAMQTREADGVCPKCGAAISADMELCPVCGWKVVDYCTFCGAPMTPDDMDCPECGMPADGVLCPDCGVRNFRPFCRQCGKPLSRAARMAVEKAKADPKVQETARLMRRMAELQAELEALEREEAIEAGRQRLFLMAFTYVLDGTMIITGGALRGMRHSTFPMLTTLVFCTLFRIIFLRTLFRVDMFHTLFWLYACFPISWVLATISNAIALIYFMPRECKKLEQTTIEAETADSSSSEAK